MLQKYIKIIYLLLFFWFVGSGMTMSCRARLLQRDRRLTTVVSRRVIAAILELGPINLLERRRAA